MKFFARVMIIWLLALVVFTVFAHGAAPPGYCVRVFVPDNGSMSMGTGILVAEDRILTNFHVVRDNKDCKILFTDWEIVEGEVIKVDKDNDLALIRIDRQCRGIITFGSPAVKYDSGRLYGYGCGLPASSYGFVSRKNKSLIIFRGLGPRFGDSGGPIVNNNGELIAILFGRLKKETYSTGISAIVEFCSP